MEAPDLKLVHKDSPISDLHVHLNYIINNINPSSSELAFYDQISSFYSGKEKVNSTSGWPAHEDNKTFSDFLNFCLDGASTRVGLFTTFHESWVGTKKGYWKWMTMHAWVGILVTKEEGKGKILVFWDPNGDEYLEQASDEIDGVIGMDILAAGQRRLLKKCKERKLKVEEVWLGGSGNRGQERCLEKCLRWMRKLAADGDLQVGKLDELGFTKLF